MADVPAPVQALMAEISAEFPAFMVIMKGDSRLMGAIDAFLKVVTLWRMKAFLTGFITTVGYTVYVPAAIWGDPNPFGMLCTLRHERVHMRQRRKYGMVLFTFLYLFFPLPAGLAYFRMKFEREAYTESLMAAAELGQSPDVVFGESWRNVVVTSFTGPSYLWAWPFKKAINAWYDATARAAVDARASKSP
jgi:hypothetical protein